MLPCQSLCNISASLFFLPLFKPSMASLLLLLPLILLSPPLLLFLVIFLLVKPQPTRIPIAGRHVFVTGGSSGIGLAIATQAAAEGARVSILARNKAKLEEARESIRRSTDANVTAYSVDVQDMDAVRRAVMDAGTIDMLVCSHGLFFRRELAEQELEEIKLMMDVNVMGTVHLIKAALPGMKGGSSSQPPRSIAIMSSQGGQVGVYGYVGYSATKFALRGLAESLQQEVVADNIRVTLVFPPDTDTPGLAEELKRRPELTSIIAGSSGRMKADEVAQRTLDGIRTGKFFVPCNFEGFMLSLATAGCSPQTSYLVAFAEVIGASFMRFVALCLQWNWYSTIYKFHNIDNSSYKL